MKMVLLGLYEKCSAEYAYQEQKIVDFFPIHRSDIHVHLTDGSARIFSSLFIFP